MQRVHSVLLVCLAFASLHYSIPHVLSSYIPSVSFPPFFLYWVWILAFCIYNLMEQILDGLIYQVKHSFMTSNVVGVRHAHQVLFATVSQ